MAHWIAFGIPHILAGLLVTLSHCQWTIRMLVSKGCGQLEGHCPSFLCQMNKKQEMDLFSNILWVSCTYEFEIHLDHFNKLFIVL